SRVALASPPGVSMPITTMGAPDSAALARPRATYSALAGPMGPSSRRTGIVAPPAAARAGPAVAPGAGAAASGFASTFPPGAATDTAAPRKAIEATTASAHRRMVPPVPPIGTSTQYSQRPGQERNSS